MRFEWYLSRPSEPNRWTCYHLLSRYSINSILILFFQNDLYNKHRIIIRSRTDPNLIIIIIIKNGRQCKAERE